jgi:hypothetical protein
MQASEEAEERLSILLNNWENGGVPTWPQKVQEEDEKAAVDPNDHPRGDSYYSEVGINEGTSAQRRAEERAVRRRHA